ncbi:MAG: dockerin type I repeat-containing protein, partial [Clostridia bacterium]|nr:dockerin type I repeat-containing protein [Clostridia bacterium]
WEGGEPKNVTSDLVLTALYEAIVQPGLLGDVDGSGSVTALYALLVMRYSMHLISDDAMAHFDLADVNGDGDVDSTDAVLIMRMTLRAI